MYVNYAINEKMDTANNGFAQKSVVKALYWE